MCTVTLLFPSNPIQANVKTFNLLFIILSRHHTLLHSHFFSTTPVDTGLESGLFSLSALFHPLPLPLHPVLLCDTQQIPAPSHTLSKFVLKWFDFQLGSPEQWRLSGSLLITWQTAASTLALPKGGEIRCLREPNARLSTLKTLVKIFKTTELTDWLQ